MLGPLCGGIVAGVLHTVLGPDHLCTIATLSACQGAEAFGFGVRWAGGHLAGLALVAVVLAVLDNRCSSATMQAYEHYADYVIGLLLVAFGGYFLVSSGRYFDAEWNPKRATCACHSADAESGHEDENAFLLPKGQEAAHAAGPHGAQGSGEEEAHGHSHHAGGQDAGFRRTGSVLMGFVQGIACPGGIVGLAFLRQYARSVWQLFLFAIIFFMVASLAMGGMAMAYGMLTQRCFSSKTLARTVYGASCCLSIMLGLTWVFLTATDRLDLYFGHSEMHHGWHDHNDAMKMDPKTMLLLAAPH